MSFASDPRSCRVAVVGLGYVGLPLAVAFGSEVETIGFDLSTARVDEIKRGKDRTEELTREELAAAARLTVTTDPADLARADVFIVTVPTPIDAGRRPDLRPLISASTIIGGQMARGAIVVYESTVYPGATEEVCAPILVAQSGLTLNEDFFLGYSPERINPGDRQHRLKDIAKVTSGSTPAAADFVDALYRLIIKAGTHRASSIRVAEAAKVIENTQRDLNIALINELALIFERMGIDTNEVLEAAGTKWNFLPFRPGLVGGHCIGVDPYYLTHKAQEIGYHPEVILAGRRINDAMGTRIGERVVRLMLHNGTHVAKSRVLVLGLTFKENCPDLRNTRVTDVIESLAASCVSVDVHDPVADQEEARSICGIDLVTPEPGTYDAIIVCVAHDEFRALGAAGIRAFGKPGAVLFDVKSMFAKTDVDGRL